MVRCYHAVSNRTMSTSPRSHRHYLVACTRPTPSQVRLAGLVVAAAFGDIKRLWSHQSGSQPANSQGEISQAKATATVRSRANVDSSGDGHQEGPTPSPAPEQQSASGVALNLYNDIVVVREMKISRPQCAAPNRRRTATRCIGFKSSTAVRAD